MSPVFEQLAVGIGELIDQLLPVRAEAGEERQVVSACKHVHRVYLDERDVFHNASQVIERGLM